jgi:hypothetical protein
VRWVARWGIGCGVPLAVWASLYFPSHRPPLPPREPLPPGDAVGQRLSLCGQHIDRDDLRYLLGDPTNLIETQLGDPEGVGSCHLFDVGQDRMTRRVEISPNDDPDFASQVKYSRTIPGAIVEEDGVGSIDRDGTSARAIVRGSRYYVVIFLRQGPMNFDKVKRILQMANKFSAALPQPTSSPRGTAPKKGSQK